MITKKLTDIFKKLLRLIELLPFLFSTSNSENDSFVIVTGADSSHSKSLYNFLSSLFIYEPVIKVIVFDLGLTEHERQYLNNTFPSAEIRLFDYSQYPDYFNINVNAGEYAWKPVILWDILNEFKGCVCWMDAGNLVTEPLAWLRRITNAVGMYSPHSPGLIADWTHSKTLQFLNVSNNLLNRPNLNGSCVSISYQNSKARDIIDQWRRCALIRECLAPQGSSRKNHRQDQAVLSVIAHQSGLTKNMPTCLHGFKTHQDID